MYCNSCGSPIGTEETVCSRCGTNIIGARAAVVARTRVAGHVQLVAVFWYVMGVFFLIPTIVMVVLSVALPAILQATGENVDPEARILVPGLFVVLALVFGVHAIVSFITGWGLQKLRPWGRTLALVMAFWNLLSPPFGTALGIYTLVVLMPFEAGEEYRRMSGLPAHSAQAAA